MRLRNFVVVGLVGLASLAFNVATAEDAVGPSPVYAALNGVSFADPAEERSFAQGGRLDISFIDSADARFSALNNDPQTPEADDRRGYEVAVTASTRFADVSFSQRGALAVDENGDIAGQSRGSELRLGRGLANMRRDQPSKTPVWYFFAASDDEALVWRPGARREFGAAPSGFALQDRVEIGDIQAGVTYERGRMQASLAYVEREISVRTAGSHTISSDESFAGLTLTMRH
ncbi:hypothetical protein U91I_02060 [alpha proteobacterium U9-1i]|nr:hypothetical protein U91I_02060 [alpha proteobacterium U9-1i]